MVKKKERNRGMEHLMRHTIQNGIDYLPLHYSLHKSTIVIIIIFYLCVCLLQLPTRPPSVLLSSASALLLHLLGYPILNCFSDWGYRESCVNWTEQKWICKRKGHGFVFESSK